MERHAVIASRHVLNAHMHGSSTPRGEINAKKLVMLFAASKMATEVNSGRACPIDARSWQRQNMSATQQRTESREMKINETKRRNNQRIYI
ncbi:hypothetical protein AVEN_8844-1 [Araneus ventricosus]|uniref:Uncharacterized protein n=1 Tax=Araneus ventricosus TaxID=182803 RepID=A0A4Y2NRX1_ARAVE|nr:hypothetical protein AVEN_8844-1 [Araneus ventricosus]